ncbi:MAG: TlpA family protein disulfide reductase [Chloroflexi bacterium]|nr:TlpA family protein disulfide reductase [Chloroflexota bacterium]
MARNRAEGRVAASSSKASAKQQRNRLMTGGLVAGALVIVAVAVIVGITVGGSGSSTGGSSAGERAPDFSFSLFQGGSDLGGKHLNIHQLDGKPVILNFWAGLCPPCRAEMPDLQAYYDDNKEDVTLVGIDIGQFMGLGSRRDAENLLRELNITYPAGFTDDRGVVRDYKVLGMPTTVFIRPDGTISARWTGALNRRILEQKIQEMQTVQ